jgi:gliding motility-associated-like protein
MPLISYLLQYQIAWERAWWLVKHSAANVSTNSTAYFIQSTISYISLFPACFDIFLIMSLRRRSLFFALLLFAPLGIVGQQRCGSVPYQQQLRNESPQLEDEDDFENWLRQNLIPRRRLGTGQREAATSYKIPVVVHVVHNGELINQGTNIPASQVASQIEVLNKDFKRLNTDAANTLTEFLPVAGSMNIEFVLAELDPEGQPSAGINRVQGTKVLWTINDDKELKSLSYWPATDYLNIWVCNLDEYVGYSQFPISSLAGLENSSTNSLTDGVVISHRAFGSEDNGVFDLYPAFNKGRTTTHELAHFFGLRHLWGDKDDCLGTDYVDDTPPQQRATQGCPAAPEKQCPPENPVNTMFQNYLDITDDNCQNLFTIGQIQRMATVLENSPRRASLLLPLDPDVIRPSFEKIFSPNGDGINDYWKWTDFATFSGCILSVFNRFGNKVFEMSSYEGSWDGRATDGQILEAEAYYYIIQCEGQNDITGGVRIVR